MKPQPRTLQPPTTQSPTPPTLPDGTILPPPYKSNKYTKLELFQFTLFHNKHDVCRAIDESQFRPKKSTFKAVFPGRNAPFDDEDVIMLLSVCEVGSDEWHDRVERIACHKYHSVQRERIYEITGFRGKGSMPRQDEVQYPAPYKESANTAPCGINLKFVPERRNGDSKDQERQESQKVEFSNKAVEYPRPPKPTTTTQQTKGGDDKAPSKIQTTIAGEVKQPTDDEKAQQTTKDGASVKLQYPCRLPLQRPDNTAVDGSKDGAAVNGKDGAVANDIDNKETTGGVIDQNDEEKIKDAATSTARRKWDPPGPYNKKQKGIDGIAIVPYRPEGALYIPAGTDANANKKVNAPIQEKPKPPQGQEKPKPPGTGIYADMPESEWLEHRFAFDLFRSRHNGANPSSKSNDLNERKLAKWARQQERCRLQVIDGTADSLTKAKVESLRQIVDFPFFSNIVRGHIERLKEYKKEHGHINVPRDEGGLGSWLTTCRTKSRSETLDPDLKALLDGMGWTVDRGQYQWEKNFEKMKEFKEKFGHCKVSLAGDQKLYSWSSRQRSDYNDGKLSQECIDKLNSIGFIWKVATKNNPMQLLEQLKAFKEEHGHFNVKSVDNHKLYSWVSFLRTRYRDGTIDETLHTKLEEIGFDWTKQIDNRIKEHLYELRAFKEEHGHCQVFGSGHTKLSKWLSSCKMRHRVGTLEKELAEELEEIGVEWIQWDVLYELLKGYYEQHGHCNLTSSSLNNMEYRKLRSWVKYQRLNYHEGTMSADRISKLEELGINWSLDDCDDEAGESDPISTMSQKDKTEEFIKRLKAFKDQHGNCNISKTSDGKLGEWVQKIRRKYKTGILDKDVQARCEEIGLQWSQWDEMFKQLQEYKELHGDCQVPGRRDEGYEYIHLGRWCLGQRANYRKGKLAQDRIDRLNEIGFVWLEYNPIDWVDMFQQLREFKEEHGHPNVPKGYQPNKRLANFVKTQRILYSKGQLKQERYDALDELGFTFSFK